MEDIEKLGLFYLGTEPESKELVFIDSKDLTTHAVILGMTGSGKTGLGITLLEEAAIDGVPALIIDPKGDMGNLCLSFPNMSGKDIAPWIDPIEAEKSGLSLSEYADKIASDWKKGIENSHQTVERIERFKSAADCVIYTPASRAGRPLSLLSSLDAPPEEIRLNVGEMRDQILSTVSSLLGLAGIQADPVQSKEHILLSAILEKYWSEGKSLDLGTLIQLIQKPPFNKIGVFDIETYMPIKERMAFAMRFNNLIASPGFQAWMEGEPLDIQRLLWSESGKPQLAILSIAHLSDTERMFFLTILLNHLIGWMRNQAGTSSLRALLYMDEIFGYFPPSSMPPSKLPMLTLLKQARAYGVGIVLATQNPVDLDYKGLANCGTWMIGKLQTQRDKERLLEGLSNFSREELDDLLSGLKKQEFILKSPGASNLIKFKTRFTLSYLKGPLTLTQIKQLSGTNKSTATPAITSTLANKNSKFELPVGVEERFAPRSSLSVPYSPQWLGQAKLHFIDGPTKLDTWKTFIVKAPFGDDSGQALWDQSEEEDPDVLNYSKTPLEGASFGEPPLQALSDKNRAAEAKRFATWLYQNGMLDTLTVPELQLTSKPDESEGDFTVRVKHALKEKRDLAVEKLKQNNEAKYTKLQEKLRGAEQKLAKQQDQATRQKFDTVISVGSTILGALFGRKTFSKGTISQAGTSIRRATRIGKEQSEVATADASAEDIKSQMAQLERDLAVSINELDESLSFDKVEIKKSSHRPRKSDIVVESLSLLWT